MARGPGAHARPAPTRRAIPGAVDRAAGRGRVRPRSALGPGRERRDRRARAVRPGDRARPGSSSTSPGPGPGTRSPARSSARDRPAGVPRQRRAGVRPRGAAAGRRARRVVDDRAHARDRASAACIAIDGRVHQGHDGTAGELGHQTIDPDGPWCGCGNRGCLEAFARADQIAHGVRHGDRRGGRDARPAPATRGPSPGSREVGRYLGIGIANMVTVVSPDRVVIGGGVAAAGDLLFAPIRAEVRAAGADDLARRGVDRRRRSSGRGRARSARRSTARSGPPSRRRGRREQPAGRR